MKLLSIIIPVYNCEKLISRCLDSICNQDIPSKYYEVIVVNDGSKDKSLDKINDFTHKIQNLHIINQSNVGAAEARNRGLLFSEGEFVHFVDADDYLLPGAYKYLLSLLKCDVDIISFYSKTIDFRNKGDAFCNYDSANVFYKGTNFDYISKYGFGNAVWNKWFRRDLLIKNGIKFENFRQAEDLIFHLNLYKVKSKIICTNAFIYCYTVNPKGLMQIYDTASIDAAINSEYEVISRIKEIEPMYNNCFSELFDKVLKRESFFVATRLLSGCFSLKRIKRNISYCLTNQIFPLENNGIYRKVLNILISYPLLFYFASFPYRYIFLPFIKPFISRN